MDKHFNNDRSDLIMTSTTTKALLFSQSLQNKFRLIKHAFQLHLPLFPQHFILQATLLLPFLSASCSLHSLCSFSSYCSFINSFLPQFCWWKSHSSLKACIYQLSSDSHNQVYSFCKSSWSFVEGSLSVSRKLLFFFKILFIYLFMRDIGKRQIHRQAPLRAPDIGLDPGTPGSRPGPKADAQPLSHPGVPQETLLSTITHQYPFKNPSHNIYLYRKECSCDTVSISKRETQCKCSSVEKCSNQTAVMYQNILQPVKRTKQGQPGWLSGLELPFGSGPDPGDPGLSPASGSLHGACFILCLCLCLSLFVCLS